GAESPVVGLRRACDGGPLVAPLQALIDPGTQHADLVRRQGSPSLGWHVQVGVETDNDEQQTTARGISRFQDRPAVAALKGSLAAVQAQSAALLLRAVAGQARLRQDRLDVALEVDAAGCGGRKLARAGVRRVAR